MERRHSFTIVEVLIVLIVLAILAAIGIPIYQNKVDDVKQDICTAHEEAIVEALKIYNMKYDVIPGSLAKVWRKYGNEATAIVWERRKNNGDYTYLAYISLQKFKFFMSSIFSLNTLCAQPNFSSTLGDRGILKCPADTSRLAIAYGLSSAAAGVRWDDIPADTIIVSDANSDGSIVYRHRQGDITGAVTTDKEGDNYLRTEDGLERRIARGHPEEEPRDAPPLVLVPNVRIAEGG